MIVKVQLSVSTTEDNVQVLIYDKSRKYRWEGDCSEEVEKLMGSELKKFFHATLEDDGTGGKKFVLGKESIGKDW